LRCAQQPRRVHAAGAPRRPRAAAPRAHEGADAVRRRARRGLRTTAPARSPRPDAGKSSLGAGTAQGGGRARAVRPAGLPHRGGRTSMTSWQQWWWVILPYAAMVVFVVGHVWRWRYDQFGWTSRSTQLQERRLLKWGAPLFHYATFAAIGGHVLGILVPRSWTEAVGIPEGVYTTFSG